MSAPALRMILAVVMLPLQTASWSVVVRVGVGVGSSTGAPRSMMVATRAGEQFSAA